MPSLKDNNADTIAAISTPPGRGGIGIVRLSGPSAVAIARSLVQLTAPLEHARAKFTRIVDTETSDANKQVLDEAVATAFFAPHSYTGEDLVELATHGSPVVLEAVMRAALAAGARLAEPGEFTQRAFLSGRLDLTQAEAVHDLIAAKTLDQARMAAQQLGGALSRRVAPAKETLLHLITLLEAGMDFASGELDDVDVVPSAQIAEFLNRTRAQLEPLAASFTRGQLLRNGAALALVGRPNAGKSSLFNRLLARDRAIVTPIPGTTRDTVEETFALGGIPLRLIDTAGIRLTGDAPADEAEAQGIARSREALADADLVLLIHDATTPLSDDERALMKSLEGRPNLIVHNKIDLLQSASTNSPTENSPSDLSSRPESAPFADVAERPASEAAPIPTSALTGEGLEQLRAAILDHLKASTTVETGALTTLRQVEAVHAALAKLAQATEANAAAVPHEVLLLDLHAALQSLDTLTGTTTTDDILGRIFSTFCIGK